MVLLPTACTEDFEEINQPPTSVTSVNPNFVFSNVQKNSVYPGFGFAYWKVHQLQYGSWAQLWGSHVVGFITARYISDIEFDNALFEDSYEHLKNLTQIRHELLPELESESARRTRDAMAEVMEVYIYERLSAALGDIPFTEGAPPLDEMTTQPEYDRQEDIYPALIAKLDAARDRMTDGDITYGQADFYYDGNIDLWRRFANSLKLKIGLRMSEANPSLAQQVVAEAMGAPLLSEHEHTAKVPTTTPGNLENVHPQIELLIRSQEQMAFLGETYVDMLKAKGDPRLTVVVEPTRASKSLFEQTDDPSVLEYRGIPHGMTTEQYNALVPDNYSYPSRELILNPEIARPMYVLTWAEVEFMKAEAALRGWGGNEADAQQFFQNGIRAALEIYGEFRDSDAIPEGQITDYLQREGTLSGGFEDKLEQIITQQWMHRLETPMEAFFDWRRTGYPDITPGPSQGETGGTIPRRGKYHSAEPALNQENYQEVISRQGPDNLTTRIWLDPQ